MQGNENIIQNNEIEVLVPDAEMVRSWAKRVFTREVIFDAALISATAAALGVIGYSLYQAMQNMSFVGAIPY